MPHTHTKDWIDVFAAFAPFVAALTAALVALMQWGLQRRQFKQSLYEKRYAIYDAARTYLAETMKKNGKDDMNAYSQFRAATDPAEFLFPESVYAHLKRIGDLCLEFCSDHETLEHYRPLVSPVLILPEDERKDVSDKFTDAMRNMQRGRKAIINELERSLKAEFAPWLKLEDDRPWYTRLEVSFDSWIKRGDDVLASRYASPKG